MKIKGIVAVLLAALMLLATACTASDGDTSADTSAEQSAESSEQSGDTSADGEKEVVYSWDVENYTQYVTLGKYMGVEIEKTVLTDEIVEKQLLALMESLKTYEDVGTTRPAAIGDVTILDYKGYREDTGEAFEGGEAEDASLELGSNSFIPGFEDAIVGHTAGESFDINVTFPENYRDGSLAGQPARFEIKLKTVKEPVYPEVNDETAKKLEYENEEAMRTQARTNAEEYVYTDNLQKAWNFVVDAAEIKSYPEALYNYTAESYEEYYHAYYTYIASMYGMELEDYIGMTEEQFHADLKEQAKKYTESYLDEEMVMFAIAEAEFGRELTDAEIQEKVEQYAKENGMTVDAFKEKYDDKTIKANVLWDKVIVYVYENAVFTSAAE